MNILFGFFLFFLPLNSFGLTAIETAILAAKIEKSDSLETKIDKALRLLNEQRYFYANEGRVKLKPPYDVPYNLDALRRPEEILAQKVGGMCGSSAVSFAAILMGSGVPEKDIQIVDSVRNQDLKIICPRARAP